MSQSSALRPIEEIAEFFTCGPSAEEIAAFRLSEPTIARVRELPEKELIHPTLAVWRPIGSRLDVAARASHRA
jgi:hypothetical protein